MSSQIEAPNPTLNSHKIGRPNGTTKENRMLAREAKGLPRIISQSEWEKTLQDAKEKVGLWLACWLAFDCIFGKRRNEICRLKYSDVSFDTKYLHVAFTVGKKKSRSEPLSSKIFHKIKSVNHYAVKYIIEYLETSPRTSEYLFTLKRRHPWYKGYHQSKKTVKVHRVFKNGKGETVEKDYTYLVPDGYRRGDSVRYYVKKVNPDIWLHLGRTTIGTRAAENGASQFDIAAILDIAPQTAWHYAEHGTAKTKDWNEETS